jgi:hypothetical protein
MAQDSTRYECPKCQADMTDQVNKECAVSVDIPMLDSTGMKTGKGARPESVSLQCPNGHWAEYPCSKTDEGES